MTLEHNWFNELGTPFDPGSDSQVADYDEDHSPLYILCWCNIILRMAIKFQKGQKCLIYWALCKTGLEIPLFQYKLE